MTTWRPTLTPRGRYEVSDDGQIRNVETGRIRKLFKRKSGHVHVGVAHKAHLIHHLVAEAFIGPRPEGLEVRHLNGIPDDNRVANLTYGTRSENVGDSVSHGVHHFARKTKCPQGHPYAGENLYIRPDGGRDCRSCRARRQKEGR